MDHQCLVCEEELNQDGECPIGCTEQEDYDVMKGYNYDERDVAVISLSKGLCFHCGGELQCPQGCYHAYNYDDSVESQVALKKGVCLICGEKVDCPNKCLN